MKSTREKLSIQYRRGIITEAEFEAKLAELGAEASTGCPICGRNRCLVAGYCDAGYPEEAAA